MIHLEVNISLFHKFPHRSFYDLVRRRTSVASCMTMENKAMVIGSYTLLEEIGTGTFGSVYRCKHNGSRRSYAAKLFSMNFIKEKDGWKMIDQEVTIMKLVSHRNTIKYKDIVYSPYGILLIMELVRGNDLFDALSIEGGFAESFARDIFRQLLQVIHFLHSKGIVHRDIKLENVMLSRTGDIKLVDYGLAEYFPNSNGCNENLMVTDCTGSPHYFAPEILNAHAKEAFRGDKADIWAAGVLLYVLVSGFLPFDGEDSYIIYDQICSCEVSFEDTGFSAELKDLLVSILEKDPKRRASVPDILAHPWMKNRPLKEKLTTFYGKSETVKVEIHNNFPEEASSCRAAFPQAMRKMETEVPQVSLSCPGRFVHEFTGRVAKLRFPLLEKGASEVSEETNLENKRRRRGQIFMNIGNLLCLKAKTSIHTVGESERFEMEGATRRTAEGASQESEIATKIADVFTNRVRERKKKRRFFKLLVKCFRCHVEEGG